MSGGGAKKGLAASYAAAEERFEPVGYGRATQGCPYDRAPEEERTFIAIVLLGEDDAPIKGEQYRIMLPDGRVIHGHLDAEGKARVDGIDPGQCIVTFPELDREAWSPAS